MLIYTCFSCIWFVYKFLDSMFIWGCGWRKDNSNVNYFWAERLGSTYMNTKVMNTAFLARYQNRSVSSPSLSFSPVGPAVAFARSSRY